MPEEIIIKVKLFEGEKELDEISVDELSIEEMEKIVSAFTAELEKRIKD